MGRKLNRNTLYTVLTVLFFMAISLPVLYTFTSGFLSGQNINELLDLQTVKIILKSILLAALVAGISTLTGSVLAFIVYKTRVAYATVFKILLFIPILISAYILAVAYEDFFTLFFNRPRALHHFAGLVFILVLHFTPLTILIIGSSLSRINASIEESGLINATPKQVVLKLIFPLIKPALYTSFSLIFVFAIADFSVASLLNVKVFSTEIFTQFSAFYKHYLAIWQSVILVLICVMLLLKEWQNIASAPFFSIGNKGLQTRLYSFSKILSLGILFVWLFISLILPFFVLIYQAFYQGTENFKQAFLVLQSAFVNSLFLAFLGAAISIFIGFWAAYFSYKQNRKLLATLLLIAFVIPPIALGISLIYFYNRPVLNFIYSGIWILLIAYTGKFAFIAAKINENALRQIPANLQEAAALTGATFKQQVFKIVLPLVSNAIFAGFLLIFILIFNELAVSMMVYPPGMDLLPVKVFTRMANAPESLTAAMTLWVYVVTLLLIVLFYFIYHKLLKRNYVTG